ncbi:hypothetical protein GGS20DRAFT_546395 [Poronia punctata]|nr:hypothetical protein GGS20DRAFT_546395 [Poronia punctata]
MEAMDMDVDVDEGDSSQRLALIRAVRVLDEDDSLPLPEKIHKIWLLLTAVKNTKLHGVEESILRWLLKQMSGSNDAAEHVRRLPLTWTILGHVFPKIPAQALGRSLAYLRFVLVLKTTLEDVTKAETEESTKTKKRKRGDKSPVTLADLRKPSGCLKTGSEIFRALEILLDQGTVYSEVRPEKRVGAEHVKSLFSSSGDETRDITAKLLLLCNDSLRATEDEASKGQQSWVNTLTAIWNLRLHNKEDILEFAKHIYGPASIILAKLEGDIPTEESGQTWARCREIWAPQLRRFMSTYLIRPARQGFAVDKNIDILKLALQIAQTDIVASVTVMWRIAARTPRDASDPKSKIEHAAWAEAVFQAAAEGLQSLPNRRKNEVLSKLLDIALKTGSIPETETLRAIYQAHALEGAEVDWTLISKIIACDADVFLVAQDPDVLFDKIAAVAKPNSETKQEIVANVIVPLEDVFARARDLSGFVTRWFRCLCAAKKVEKSIWCHPSIREHLATILEASLSGPQLLRLLEGLESIASTAGEILVVLDGVCAGLTDESTISAIHPKITSLIEQDYEGVCSDVLALRWRVAGYLASWATTEESNRLWKKIKAGLKPILKKGSLGEDQTFEAFSCCSRFCLSNHIGGKYEGDITKLVCAMVERLIASVKTEADLQLLKPYVDLVFSQLPRLSEQPKQEVNTLTEHIVGLFWRVTNQPPDSHHVRSLELVRPLIHNSDMVDEESFLDAAINPLLDALDGSGEQHRWTQPNSRDLLLTLLEFPVEAWTRGRRKRMMGSWKKQKSAISSLAKKDAEYGLAVMRLLVKIVQQPTLYEEMEFADLLDVCSTVTAGNATLLAMAERFVNNTTRQVTANANASTRVYLASASQWAMSLQSQGYSEDRTPIIVLRSLVAALTDRKVSSASIEQLGVEPDIFNQKLASVVGQALSDFASEAKKLSVDSLSDANLQSISIVLDAAQVLRNGSAPLAKLELSDTALGQLDEASNTLVAKDATVAWKLRAFLVRQSPDRYTADYFCAVLEYNTRAVGEELIHSFVDGYVQEKGQSFRDQVLPKLMDRDKLISGPIAPLVAAQRLLELYQASNDDRGSSNTPTSLDLAKIHEHVTSHLSQTESLAHFKQISETMLFLLDKHANAMTQYNIEATLTSVVQVCSVHGPNIQGSTKTTAAGEIFTSLFKIVSLIIKRHRLRLSGHFHIILAALRALLTVLLADPTTTSRHPPWLHSRLQPRHAERFARLLTLICEPSAASVAPSSRARSELDSATDKAKRAAGQYMYLLLEVYVKLQLEVEVTRDMRKALEVGVFSVLDITGEGCRKVLNESLDAAGRAVFRALFAEYRKFGKWKGV